MNFRRVKLIWLIFEGRVVHCDFVFPARVFWDQRQVGTIDTTTWFSKIKIRSVKAFLGFKMAMTSYVGVQRAAPPSFRAGRTSTSPTRVSLTAVDQPPIPARYSRTIPIGKEALIRAVPLSTRPSTARERRVSVCTQVRAHMNRYSGYIANRCCFVMHQNIFALNSTNTSRAYCRMSFDHVKRQDQNLRYLPSDHNGQVYQLGVQLYQAVRILYGCGTLATCGTVWLSHVFNDQN